MKSALIKLHTAVFLVGFTGILGVLIQLSELPLVWYRISITVISLFVLLKLKKQFTPLPKKSIQQLLLIGTVIALHWVCFYGSIKLSNVSIALICFSSTGLFTALLEPLLITKRIRWIELGLGLFSITGIYLIFHFDDRYKTGIIVGVIAAVLAALFSVLNKKYLAITDAKQMMLYELIGGWLILTCLLPFYIHLFPNANLYPTLTDWGWLLILSWVCTIVAMQLMLESLQKVSAFTQNLSLNLEPVYAIIMAFLLFQENKALHSSFYIGVALILFSVILQMLRIVIGKRT